MIFGFFVVAIFAVISIYFFFKAEGLQKQLLQVKKDSKNAKNENKKLADSMALMISRNEEFVKQRTQKVKDSGSQEVNVIAPLVNNYAVILREALQGKGRVKAITKKCYDNCTPEAFKVFTTYISKQDASVKRMWSSNNLSGYISLVEALLLTQEAENIKTEKTKSI